MAATRELLQPSLLDRLSDDEPDKNSEARERRQMTFRQLRDAVVRDLSWLLNATNLASEQPLDGFPNVAASVVNFGLPALAGASLAGSDPQALEARLKQAILTFEPRLLRRGLNVTLSVDPERMTGSAVVFVIEGELWADPEPERIRLKTELDIELGSVEVTEDARGV